MELLLQILPYLAAVVVWFAKDKILHLLNVKQKETEVDSSIITNHEKNIKLYQEMLDDIDARYKKRIEELEESFNTNIERLKAINQELSEIIANQGTELIKYKSLYGHLPEDDE